MRRRGLFAAAVLVAVLAQAGPSGAGPLTVRLEDVNVTTIEGSILVGEGPTGPIIISYTITLTRATGTYVVDTAQTPGTEYATTRGCISFAADFFSDSGCARKITFKQAEDLSTSSGSFKAKLKQNRIWVSVSFSAKATGEASSEPHHDYSLSQPSSSATASAGQWTERAGRPTGWIGVAGFPRTKMAAEARLSHGTILRVGADA